MVPLTPLMPVLRVSRCNKNADRDLEIIFKHALRGKNLFNCSPNKRQLLLKKPHLEILETIQVQKVYIHKSQVRQCKGCSFTAPSYKLPVLTLHKTTNCCMDMQMAGFVLGFGCSLTHRGVNTLIHFSITPS